MFKFLILTTIVSLVASWPINSSLKQILKSKGSANVIIRMSNGTEEVLQQLSQIKFTDRSSRLNTVVNTLKSHAAKSQRSILDILSTTGNLKYDSLWISNEIYIANANSGVVQHLSSIKGIAEIYEENIVHLDSCQIITNLKNMPAVAEQNIEKIQANRVWEELGIFGEGAVVGSIDTGVRGTHEALSESFLGSYGWFDPPHGNLVPVDEVGQGTHTMGIMVGKFGIGVAPGAKWMSCRGCASTACAQSDLIKCAQFISCPTLQDGTFANCSKAPHVVNNGWGGGQGDWFDPSIRALKLAGVVPVFAVGNSGPNCGTISSPAGSIAGVISVAGTTLADQLGSFSSKGPTIHGEIKPDITAPNSGRSAYHTSDSAYATLTGSVIASSHVSGTIGLLNNNTVGLSYDQIKKFLLENADRTVPTTGRNCGGIDEETYPNNAAGWGRVNAYKAVKAFLDASK